MPSGQAIDKSVFTIPRSPALMIVASELARSNPAENGDPRVGIEAFSERRFTCILGDGPWESLLILFVCVDVVIEVMLRAAVNGAEKK